MKYRLHKLIFLAIVALNVAIEPVNAQANLAMDFAINVCEVVGSDTAEVARSHYKQILDHCLSDVFSSEPQKLAARSNALLAVYLLALHDNDEVALNRVLQQRRQFSVQLQSINLASVSLEDSAQITAAVNALNSIPADAAAFETAVELKRIASVPINENRLLTSKVLELPKLASTVGVHVTLFSLDSANSFCQVSDSDGRLLSLRYHLTSPSILPTGTAIGDQWTINVQPDGDSYRLVSLSKTGVGNNERTLFDMVREHFSALGNGDKAAVFADLSDQFRSDSHIIRPDTIDCSAFRAPASLRDSAIRLWKVQGDSGLVIVDLRAFTRGYGCVMVSCSRTSGRWLIDHVSDRLPADILQSAEFPPYMSSNWLHSLGDFSLESGTATLSSRDLDSLTERKLILMRNEPFARHGRKFSEPWIQRYFCAQHWYVPDPNYVDDWYSVASTPKQYRDVELITSMLDRAYPNWRVYNPDSNPDSNSVGN